MGVLKNNVALLTPPPPHKNQVPVEVCFYLLVYPVPKMISIKFTMHAHALDSKSFMNRKWLSGLFHFPALPLLPCAACTILLVGAGRFCKHMQTHEEK